MTKPETWERDGLTLRLVYVDYGTEDNPEGARLMAYPSEELIELTKDQKLIQASEDTTTEDAQGIVCAYLGVDGHWHLAHRLSPSEVRKHGI